jgi:hypothetical protein
MDAQQIARDYVENITARTHPGCTGRDTGALLAIAAALIAATEALQRKPEFVQVGEVRINTQAIFRVSHYTDEDGIVATVMTEGGAAYSFEGPEATAFLLWHEQHANVTRLEEVE